MAKQIPPSGERPFFTGDDRTIRINVTDNDGKRKDLSGGSGKFEVYDGDTATIQKDESGDLSFVSSEGDATKDQVKVEFNPSDTSSLSVSGRKVYYYECEITDSDGDVSTVQNGDFVLKEDKV